MHSKSRTWSLQDVHKHLKTSWPKPQRIHHKLQTSGVTVDCYWSFPGFYKYKVKAFGLGLFLCTPASVMLPFILFWFKYGFPWFLCISIIIVLSWVCWYFNILVSVSTYGYFIGFLVFWFIGYANKSVLSHSGLPLSSFFVRACVPCGSLIFLDFCLLPFWT